MAQMAMDVVDDLLRLSKREESHLKRMPSHHSLRLPDQRPGTPQSQAQLTKQQSFLSLSLKRAGSSLRNLAFGSPGDGSATSRDATPQTSPSKPKEPAPPLNTPRGRLPAEWSRPPETSDSPGTTGAYQSAHLPPSAGFVPLDPTVKQRIPLQSTLVEWSTEYFREPQMRPNDPDEPGSADYNSRLWRRNRNEKIIADNQPLKAVAGSSKWTRLEGFLNNHNQPMRLTFHQFDDHLAVTDDRDTVTIWDWQRNERLSRFCNANPAGSRINDAKFLNEDDQPLLMVGSSDGVLKVYRNYAGPDVKVIAAFRALTELVPSNRNAGLVFDWQQGQGKALVAGDVKVVKVWNAATETCVGDIPARSSSCVTSLTSDQVAGQIFVAGFGDGVVRVFDQRLNPRTAMVRIWREHQQWVTNVHMQRGGVRELVSGSRNGEVKLWDLRHDRSVLTLDTNAGGGGNAVTTGERDHPAVSSGGLLRSLAVHEHAPVFAVGTDRHEVQTFNTHGDPLGAFEPPPTRLAQVVGGGLAGRAHAGPVVATAYHPHRMLLACAARGDGHVSLVSC
jgi:regulator-associated protein of mTOR